MSPIFSGRDLYRRLGVPPTATTEEIKRAFKRQALLNHPDLVPGDPLAGVAFQKLHEACRVLNSPGLRQLHDIQRATDCIDEGGRRYRQAQRWLFCDEEG